MKVEEVCGKQPRERENFVCVVCVLFSSLLENEGRLHVCVVFMLLLCLISPPPRKKEKQKFPKFVLGYTEYL